MLKCQQWGSVIPCNVLPNHNVFEISNCFIVLIVSKHQLLESTFTFQCKKILLSKDMPFLMQVYSTFQEQLFIGKVN